MGSIVGKAMDENMKKQQEFMLLNQKAVMERQIQMQNYMREQAMAMQLARSRDLFAWFSSFYGLAALGLTVGFLKRRTPGFIVPLVPLTFIEAYQYDLAYGSKMKRIREEADRMLREESHLVDLPHGLPTVSQLDARRGLSSD